MAKNNRVCKVCGSEYNFCPTCAGVTATEKYRTMFCSKNCRDVFHTISRYFVKDVSKDEAKEILSSLDLSKRNNFNDAVKSDIDEIMGVNKKQFKKKEESVVIEVTEPTIPEEI